MLSRLETTLNKCSLNPNKPILVGLSGGPDSLCLIDTLHRKGYALIAAHLNHQLRPEADTDAHEARCIAETRALPFILEQKNVGAHAETNNLSIEEAARTLRYNFLFEQAHAHGAQAVAVGHNADDQVETVLMHLLRGAGLAGLKGMRAYMLPNSWSDSVALVRPLLNVWRDEILAYCQKYDLEAVFDRSNLDTTYFRNRLRHVLIPYLDEYVPGLRERLRQMAEILAGDHAVLERVVHAAWDICIDTQGDGFVAFDARKLAHQPLGVRRRLIRRAVAALRPDLRDLSFDAVERALAALEPPSRKMDLALGLQAFVEDGRF
ncbi:MAG: tRNA lysidine(34) synthetase TilS, partial [Chloroflexota bacterium]|nr:tRNA lysidine(34) synthetase TilS [Chloroflexota bacterium]